jgi:hypothetical protein
LAIVASWFRKNRGEFQQTFDPAKNVRAAAPKPV